MRRRSMAVLVLGAVAVLALAACGGGDADGGNFETVTSDDGLVTIEIPEGALPDGVEATDLAVSVLDLDGFEVEEGSEGGTRVVAAIRLEPSGTVFESPVTVRTRLPIASAPGLSLLVSDDGSVEVLELTFEEDEDEVIASVAVGHFSELVYMGSVNTIEFEFDPPIQDRRVGETFTVRARISRIDFEEEVKRVLLFGEAYLEYRFRPSDDRDWALDVSIGVRGPAVTDARADFEESVEPERSAVFVEAEVTCERPGPYVANIGGYAMVGVRAIPLDPSAASRDLRSNESYGDFVEESALCLAAEETATPFPTPSPTATPAVAIPPAFDALLDATLNSELDPGQPLTGDQQDWFDLFVGRADQIVFGPTVSSFPVGQVAPREPSRPETVFQTSGAGFWDVSDDGRQRLFLNTVFPCGAGEFAFTLCPEPLGSSPGGDHVVVITQLGGPVPVPVGEPDAQYQYGFVFDADGSTAGNYQASPSFPNDFFDGTDRWYTANYSPSTGWTMSVTQVTDGAPRAVASAARIVILDDLMALVVPASEFGVARPAYRVTAFWHTGDFGRNPPNVWSGDVFPAVADGLSTNYLDEVLVIAE